MHDFDPECGPQRLHRHYASDPEDGQRLHRRFHDGHHLL
nr:MAG TPA: hypothetical protein [Caudoviricetes sp.]